MLPRLGEAYFAGKLPLGSAACGRRHDHAHQRRHRRCLCTTDPCRLVAFALGNCNTLRCLQTPPSGGAQMGAIRKVGSPIVWAFPCLSSPGGATSPQCRVAKPPPTPTHCCGWSPQYVKVLKVSHMDMGVWFPPGFPYLPQHLRREAVYTHQPQVGLAKLTHIHTP